MSRIYLLVTLLLSYFAVCDRSNAQEEIPPQTGPYLGQSPPGSIPEVFAPGLVTTKYKDNSGFFTPDMKEFYLTRRGGKHQEFTLVVFKENNGQWQESTVMPRVGRPLIAPTGKIMHLGEKYMRRTNNGWSEVKSLGFAFENKDIMRLSSSLKGMYVFDEIGLPEGDGMLRYSRLIDGKREAPKLFGKQINSGKYTAHPFIAPDESYLIWDSEKEDGHGKSDLYISFRQNDESWGKAINLGDKINTKASEGGAYVTPDGKYFFFNRNINPDNYDNVDIFWVDAGVIFDLRDK